jgi:hypothetical protein
VPPVGTGVTLAVKVTEVPLVPCPWTLVSVKTFEVKPVRLVLMDVEVAVEEDPVNARDHDPSVPDPTGVP